MEVVRCASGRRLGWVASFRTRNRKRGWGACPADRLPDRALASRRDRRGWRLGSSDWSGGLFALRPALVRFAVVDRLAVERVLAAGFPEDASRFCRASRSLRSAVPSLPLSRRASLMNFPRSSWRSRAPRLTSLPTSLRRATSAFCASSSALFRRLSAAGSAAVVRLGALGVREADFLAAGMGRSSNLGWLSSGSATLHRGCGSHR